mmetsp:Transcript_16383/g.18889  ORF Transcript_16383/g.18889 Transcript_16383/m.18889 type:complete len:153 (+) Transcript_16383:85-543(+)
MEKRTIEDVAIEILERIDEFSNEDHMNKDWHDDDPPQIFDSMDKARKEMMNIWNNDHQDDDDDCSVDTNNNDLLKSLYIETVTDAFADEIDELRKKDCVDDVNILVNCLQSGMDFLTSEEINLLVDKKEDDDEIMASSLTPHEKRQREVGFS